MRAPEEYESNSGQDDKIDVFSLGSSLYHLLSGSPPFHEENFGDAVKFIKKGVELELPDHVKDDPTLAHIVKAIILCRQKDPKKRPFSREIASDLKKALKEVEEEA
jgi:serine/threonine protein kinase